MINDLAVNNALLWKYVDDTPASEIISKGADQSNAQSIVDTVVDWSYTNRVKMNKDKCKELRISFARVERNFPPVVMDGENVKVVESKRFVLECSCK